MCGIALLWCKICIRDVIADGWKIYLKHHFCLLHHHHHHYHQEHETCIMTQQIDLITNDWTNCLSPEQKVIHGAAPGESKSLQPLWRQLLYRLLPWVTREKEAQGEMSKSKKSLKSHLKKVFKANCNGPPVDLCGEWWTWLPLKTRYGKPAHLQHFTNAI